MTQTNNKQIKEILLRAGVGRGMHRIISSETTTSKVANVDTFTEATAAINKLIVERDKKHQKIYDWLLGEAGEFPVSEIGKRYGWRPELRKRLAELKSQL